MKKLLLLATGIVFFFCNTNAQLVADAGNDQSVCLDSSFAFLGGSPTATGGTPPYNYSWNPSAPNVANPIVVVHGNITYSLLVTDALGDTATDAVIITALPTPNVSIAPPPNLTCAVTSVTLTASSSTIGVTYDWGSGITTPTRVVSITGSYSVTVMDPSNNCTASGSTNVFQNTVPPNLSIAPPAQLTCVVTSVTLTASSTTIGVTYNWGGGNTTTTIMVSAPGSYSVTVTDPSNGCSASASTTVSYNCSGFNFTTQNPTCFGSCNGSTTINPPAGNYNYQWSNAATTATIVGLCAGIYTVTVMDSVLTPLDTLSVTVNQPTQIIAMASSTNASCGSNNGAIVLTAAGGTPPYTFVWSTGFIGSVHTGLVAGVYTATVTDGNGCSASAMAVVSQPPQPSLTANATNATGCGVCDGTATLSVSGGTLPVTYWWSNFVTTPTQINLCPGVYIGYVTDMNGCSDTAIAVVNAAGSTLNVTTSVSGHVTCTNPNGVITASVSGGIPPYTYLWSSGDTTSATSGLTFGLYTVSVTDSSGCSGFAVDTVFNQQSFNYFVYVTGSSTNCSSNGSATATVYGGTPPYTYLWNTTPAQTTQTATGLAGGAMYSVTVSDSLACERTGSSYVITSCRNIILGRLINDLNGNCVLDSNETPLANQSVIADGTIDYYGYSDAQGYYNIPVPAGTYIVRPYHASSCAINCSGLNTSFTYTFPTVGDTVSNAVFFLVPAPFNLYTTNGSSAFRPGFNATVYLYYGNTGTDTTDATLTYTYDTDLTYLSSTNGGVHNAGSHTVTWTLPDIAPRIYNYYGNYYVSVIFLTPIGTPINTPITNHARIIGPPAECDTTDNTHVLTTPVRNSYDPNDKAVMPDRDIYDESDSVLTYTIRFQNTGNDTAWFVILKDTLSANLQPATVQNLASSHAITEFTISGTGILTWVFNPIYLVDSFTNEPASHGYVMFRVKKKAGLAIGTEIKNTAHIYFDYNEPVATNTVTSRVADPNFIFTIKGDESISVTAMPNPFTQSTQVVIEGINSAFDFELFDVTGKLMKKISAINDNRFELKRDDMSAGVYFYRITTTAKQRAYGRVVVE